MLKRAFFILLSLYALQVYALKEPIRFGKPELSELEMTIYEPDTSAIAVVLCDYGYFDTQNFTFTRTLRIKILKKEGLEWANQTYPATDKTNVRGKTFNLENGEIVESKLKTESIFRERIMDDYYSLNIAMPNARVGSVIDIEFNSPGIMPGGIWYFQQEIPVKWSELRFESSPYIDFRKNYYGYISFHESSDWRWVTKDVPAFKVEPYTNSIANYICKFEFDIMSIQFPGFYKSYTTSWEAVCRLLQENYYFGEAVRGNLFLNSVAKEIESKAKNDKEKLQLAFEEAKKVKWDNKERLFTTYTSLSSAYNKEIGNSADINLILVALLNKMDITSYPVILSTRDNGLLPYYPTIEKLNYTMCYAKIGDIEYLIDATDQYLPIGLLPDRCLNNTCRIVKGENSLAMKVEPNGEDKEDIVSELALSADNTLLGKLSYRRYDYSAYTFRTAHEQYTNEDDYLEDMENEYPGLIVNSMQMENLDSLHLPVSDNYDIRIKNAITVAGDLLYLTPLLHHQLVENPFKPDSRTYPVDFTYKRSRTIVITYTLPDGYEVEELPAPARFGMPNNDATVLYNVTQMGNKITVIYKFKINKILFLPTEYKLLKEFYNLIIEKHAEPIILKKV